MVMMNQEMNEDRSCGPNVIGNQDDQIEVDFGVPVLQHSEPDASAFNDVTNTAEVRRKKKMKTRATYKVGMNTAQIGVEETMAENQ